MHVESASEFAARIPDGASLALAPDYSGCAMAVVGALIRRGAEGLHLIGVPQLGLQADLLIGSGCASSVETAAVTLGELARRRALWPRSRRALSSSEIRPAR